MPRREKSLSERFAIAVRATRERKGLTQEKLGELARIDPKYVGMIERNERRPSLEIAGRIAEGLGVKLSSLIKRIEQPGSKK